MSRSLPSRRLLAVGLAVALSAGAIAVTVGAGAAAAANPLVVANVAPGIGTPLSTLGGYPMRSLPTDNLGAPEFSTFCALDVISWLPCASARMIGSGWATWSHGYGGFVYFLSSTAQGDIATINLPWNTNAFSFDIESNNFNPTAPATQFTYVVDASGSGAPGITTAVTVAPNGSSNARYVGFYSKAPSKANLIQSLKITCLGKCNGFAIGEFKINQGRLTHP